jgi:hypothetical protein
MNLQRKLFHSRNNLLCAAKMTLATNNFPFSLASRASLSIEVIVSSSKLYSFGGLSFSLALVASHDVIRVLSSSSFAVGTSDLLLN